MLGGMRTIMAMCLATSLSVAVPGCCYFKGTCGKFLPDLIECSSEAVVKEMANILPAVMGILTGGAIDWAAQLKALEVVGADVVACAIAKAVAQLKMPALKTASASQPAALRAVTFDERAYAIARGEAYLSSLRKVPRLP